MRIAVVTEASAGIGRATALAYAAALDERAARLRRSRWQAIEKSGFREYYDPFTGEGLGAREFTWSGLLLDMLP